MAQVFKGTFSFKDDNIAETSVARNIKMRAERLGVAICRIYFVDDRGAAINIPPGFTVTDNTNNLPVAPAPGVQYFVLAWSDNYTLALNGQPILTFDNQRQWSLMGPTKVQVDTIQP